MKSRKVQKCHQICIGRLVSNILDKFTYGPTLARLIFYKNIKTEFKMESYFDTLGLEHRRAIAKLRCSAHTLEIEKGRHKGIHRLERKCTLCHNGQVEAEVHFLFLCNT